MRNRNDADAAHINQSVNLLTDLGLDSDSPTCGKSIQILRTENRRCIAIKTDHVHVHGQSLRHAKSVSPKVTTMSFPHNRKTILVISLNRPQTNEERNF